MDDRQGKIAVSEMRGLRLKLDILRKSKKFFKDVYGFLEEVDRAAKRCGFLSSRGPVLNIAPRTAGANYATRDREARMRKNPHKRVVVSKPRRQRPTKTEMRTHTVAAPDYDPSGKVICRECRKPLRVVTASHLKRHNMTIKEYEKKWPGVDRFAKKK